jgi:predicted MFS family arabinose efflux permease
LALAIARGSVTDTAGPLPDRRVLVTALGVTQILSWGSTFYLLGVLAPYIARDTGWGYDWVIAGVSIGLLFAGLVSPRVGRLIANHGGRPVLAAASMLLATGLFGVGLAPNFAWYLVAWAVVGVGMGAGLYDAAFSTLGSIYGAQARGAITSVTLFGGFASTVCWPLSAYVVQQFGWRETCFLYAAIQVVVALPIHVLVLPRGTRAAGSTAIREHAPVRLRAGEHAIFAVLAGVVTIGAAILSTMGTHLLPLLQARGLDLALAVGLGTIVGPAQVGARIVEMFAGRYYHPVWTMVASAGLVAISAVMLLCGFPLVALAIAFYGAGNGIGSVARGTVPLALFGPERYPVLMGRLALPLLIAMSISPFLGGIAFQLGGADWTFMLLAALAIANMILVVLLRVMSVRHAAQTT